MCVCGGGGGGRGHIYLDSVTVSMTGNNRQIDKKK